MYLSYIALIKIGHDTSKGLRFCLHLKYHVVGNGGYFSSPLSIWWGTSICFHAQSSTIILLLLLYIDVLDILLSDFVAQ